MFDKLLRLADKHRLPIPDCYRLPAKYAPAVFLSSFLIVTGLTMLLLAALSGVRLYSQPSNTAPKVSQSEINQVVFELRTHAFTEVAAMETLLFRQSLERLRLATAQEQREDALRLAKAARANALLHLAEAESTAHRPEMQSELSTLRAEIAQLDRQLAIMPGTHGN